MNMRKTLWIFSLAVLAAACTNAGRLKSDKASLESDWRQLQAQGALQTSPKEMALAKANFDFFDEEYDERDYWAAEDALAHIRENVQKAKTHTNLASDADGDGVVDIDDLCPEDKGSAASSGCPGEGMGQPIAPGGPWGDVSRQIVFQPGSSKLMRFSERALDPLVAALAADPTSHVRVEGHTDAVGDPQRNKELSTKRADAVRGYLVSHGVDGSQVSAVGYGAERPLASNATPEGRQANRRVEIHPE